LKFIAESNFKLIAIVILDRLRIQVFATRSGLSD